jgi:hypothetical protein
VGGGLDVCVGTTGVAAGAVVAGCGRVVVGTGTGTEPPAPSKNDGSPKSLIGMFCVATVM